MCAVKDFYKSVYGAEDAQHAGKPHGWIQWKGTNVCVDLHCVCGEHSHVDGGFAYFFQCKCGKKYALGQNIQLLELTPEQVAYVENNTCGFTTETEDGV